MPDDEAVRGQFTFYESFARALRRIKKKADRADAYDVICNYALYGIDPDMDSLPDAVAIAFDLIKPNLDTSKRRAKAGKQGGSKQQASDKQTESKKEANEKRGKLESEKEGEIEKEKEIEKGIEKDSYISQQAASNADLSRVMTLYMDRVQSMPSPSCVDLLESYTVELGADVVCHAIERALDDNKRSWSYIQGILRRYSAEGLTSLEAVQASEAEFARAKERGAQAIPKTTAQRKSFSELIAERTGMK